MPSKGLLRPGQALAEARRDPRRRGGRRAASVDVAAVVRPPRRDRPRPRRLRPAAVARGPRHRAGPRPRPPRGDRRAPRRPWAATGGAETLEARRAVIVATGTAALIPPVPGLARGRAVDQPRGHDRPRTVPGRLIVLGGGPVGCEMAQAYRSLGAEVTLVEGGPHLLGREEPYAGAQLRAAFEADGIDVRTGVKATAVRRPTAGGPVERRPRRRHDRRGRRAALRARPPAADRRPRARVRRPRARRPDRGRRRPARRGPRLALRPRRRQRPDPADPHGQVPGPDRRRRACSASSTPLRSDGAPLPAGHVHRAAGRGRRPHARRRPRGRPRRVLRRDRDERQRRRQLLRPRRRRHHADGRSSAAPTACSGSRWSAPRSPTSCTRRRSR